MTNFPLATIPATDACTLPTAVNQGYLVSVALPLHYRESPERTYPVIYEVDANLYFGMVVEMVRVMNVRVSFCNELPDLAILCAELNTNEVKVISKWRVTAGVQALIETSLPVTKTLSETRVFVSPVMRKTSTF